LLQVLALALVGSPDSSLSQAKIAIFNKTSVTNCSFGQYDGYLLEPKLKYHSAFADATLCYVDFSVDIEGWADVPITIATGKDMGTTLYTVEFYQRGGPGVLTFEIGKEETGLGGVKVQNWPLKDASEFQAPAPGFGSSGTIRAKPAVSSDGNGYILNYSDPSLYFPKPYALMAAALLTRDYGTAFVTYPECRRSWEIVTSTSSGLCLDPAPEHVHIYKVPDTCGQTAPKVCWQPTTVKTLYEDTYKCSAAHDVAFVNVSVYEAKCHPHGHVEVETVVV